MKKNYLVFVTLLAICVLGNMACKKGSSKSKTELMTQTAWKIDDVGLDMDKNGTIDASTTDDCEADNTITFKTDGTAIQDEGAIICNGSTQTSTFNWSFKSSETIINIDINDLGDINISSLTDSEFKGWKDVDNGIGGTWRVQVILKH